MTEAGTWGGKVASERQTQDPPCSSLVAPNVTEDAGESLSGLILKVEINKANRTHPLDKMAKGPNASSRPSVNRGSMIMTTRIWGDSHMAPEAESIANVSQL